jgi:hypothetical protein
MARLNGFQRPFDPLQATSTALAASEVPYCRRKADTGERDSLGLVGFRGRHFNGAAMRRFSRGSSSRSSPPRFMRSSPRSSGLRASAAAYVELASPLPTSEPGLGSPQSDRHRDWAHPSQIGTGTGLSPVRSAPGLGSAQSDRHRDWARRSHICAVTGHCQVAYGVLGLCVVSLTVLGTYRNPADPALLPKSAKALWLRVPAISTLSANISISTLSAIISTLVRLSVPLVRISVP